jgi:hypothetical protein
VRLATRSSEHVQCLINLRLIRPVHHHTSPDTDHGKRLKLTDSTAGPGDQNTLFI